MPKRTIAADKSDVWMNQRAQHLRNVALGRGDSNLVSEHKRERFLKSFTFERRGAVTTNS